jgi:hypothetical protein
MPPRANSLVLTWSWTSFKCRAPTWPDAAYWANVLEARLVFAVEFLIYRVEDLDRTEKELRAEGWKRGRSIDIPHGPCMSFATPGGQRVAIYQLTRPGVADHFVGRMAFVPLLAGLT